MTGTVRPCVGRPGPYTVDLTYPTNLTPVAQMVALTPPLLPLTLFTKGARLAGFSVHDEDERRHPVLTRVESTAESARCLRALARTIAEDAGQELPTAIVDAFEQVAILPGLDACDLLGRMRVLAEQVAAPMPSAKKFGPAWRDFVPSRRPSGARLRVACSTHPRGSPARGRIASESATNPVHRIGQGPGEERGDEVCRRTYAGRNSPRAEVWPVAVAKEPPGETPSRPSGAAGAPGDALGPVADALLAAAGTAATEPVGDPRVRASLQLGWLMDDILAGRAQSPLPGEPGLPAVTGFKAQAHQLTTILGALKLAGLDPKAVVDGLASGAAGDPAAKWQPDLVVALFGADVRFAKAYGLGRQLNALGQPGSDPRRFEQKPIADMLTVLDELSTALPPHAGRAVANSVRRWVALTDLPKDAAILAAQCGLWRTLLSGEKSGTELLEPENYLDAADRLGAKLYATGTALLKQLPGLVIGVVALFLAGVAILVLAPTHATTTAAGLSGVIAAVGLTWKGIGGALGKLIGRLEAPLWRAEVDGAITDAITLVRQGPPASSIKDRRAAAATGDYAGRAQRATGTVTP